MKSLRVLPIALSSFLVCTAAPASTAFAGVRANHAVTLSARSVVAHEASSLTQGDETLGTLPDSKHLQLAVGLRLRNQSQLEQLLSNLYNTASPMYGQFMTPKAFRARFSPTPSQVAQVAQYFQDNGLHVKSVAPNGLVMDVEGTASQVNHAFGVTERAYKGASGTVYAPDRNATLPSRIAPLVAGVAGLDNVQKLSGHLKVNAHATGSVGGYSPAQIQRGYNYAPLYQSWKGHGQTIAIVTSGSTQSSDVHTFDATFGLPDPVMHQTVVDGTTQANDETTLDVEWSHAIAPTAAIQVYEAASPDDVSFTDAFNRVASEDKAHVVTTSWGASESETSSSTVQADHGIFEEMAAQGQSVFAAAGDNGSSDGQNGNNVDYPSADSYVTACGGTTLALTTTGNRISETAWSDGGGGQSKFFGHPSWQYGPGVKSTQTRQTADVSLNANPRTGYDVYYHGAWEMVGGTSVVAPEMAGTFALIDQSRAIRGKHPVGLANVGIYAMARDKSYANLAYHDIISGTNGAYSSGRGYDSPTGWGSINAYYFVHGLI